MKILAVSHDALDPVHRSLYDAIGRVDGIELMLVVPKRWYDNYRMIEWDPADAPSHYAVRASSVLFGRRTHRLIYLSLGKHLRKFKPDILYMESEPENFQTFQGARALHSAGSGATVFASWRNLDYRVSGFPYKFASLHRKAEEFVLGHARAGIVFSARAKEIFDSIGFPRTTVLPPAIDLGVFKRSGEGIGRSKFTIGFVGRFVEPKGVSTLLKAAAGLPFDFTLLLVGAGPAQPKWRSLARSLRIADRVRWVPPQPRNLIPGLLEEMDALVLPSWTTESWKEQFGRILIEAMACGVPVVGSDSGEIPTVVGDAGTIVPEKNAGELRRALIRIRDDAGYRNETTARGLLRVAEEYDAGKVAAKYCALFKGL